jgi:hypothetical protein
MKNIFLILILVVLCACKKESTEVQTTQPPTVTPQIDPANKPCADRHTYGDSCQMYYGDFLTGTWTVYDSSIVRRSPSMGVTTYDTIVGVHECEIFDSILIVSKDTFRWFYIRNVWNKGGVDALVPSAKDSFRVGIPKLNGFPSTIEQVWIAPAKSYTYSKLGMTFDVADPFGKKYVIQSYIYMRMVKK